MTRRTHSAFRAITLALAAILLAAPSLAAEARPRPAYGRIELIRDAWGVPHIFSETDAGALYGLGYAAAEDRLYQMHFQLRLMQGRLAEAVGDLRKRQQRPTGPNSALEQDRLMRTLGYHRHAKEVTRSLDDQTLQLLTAYSEGVNDYVAEHAGQLHPLFEAQGWQPEPWTPADCLVSWWHLAQFFAGDGLRDLWTLHQSAAPGARRGSRMRVDDDAAVVQREDVSEQWIEQTMQFMRRHGLRPEGESGADPDAPKFSHAWVIGGSRTTTGAAVLVSDPQTPVWNPSMLYEFHIAGSSFNARGAGVAGSPLILIGFNEHVAWGMTALGADQADLFLLRTDPRQPGKYQLDDRWIDMSVRTETIEIAGGDRHTLTVHDTLFGPVVSEFALDRRQGEEVALKRIPLAENDRDTIQGAFAMMRAKSAAEFGAALSGWRFPTANCIFGDRLGNIGYWTAGAIPVRAAASPGPMSIQDGASRQGDWQTYIPHDLLPHVINPKRGYLVSANNRAIQSFYQLTLGASTGAPGDTDRGWRIKQRIEEFLAGDERFTPEDVRAIQDDKVNAVKKQIVRIGLHVRDVQKAPLDAHALRALAHLEQWHARGAASDIRIPGAELANQMQILFRETVVPLTNIYGGGVSGLVLAMKTLGDRLDADPAAQFEPDEIRFIERVLAEAWQRCQRAYGADPAKWPDAAIAAAQQYTLGYFESLDGYPSLDPTWDVKRPLLQVYDGGTILAQPGQSYTQYVPLHNPDTAESILPPGQSERPESPFRFSTMGLWATGQLHPAPLSRASVEAIAAHRRSLSDPPAPRRVEEIRRGR